MKICSICNESKDLTEFYLRSSGSDDYHKQCKNCMAQRKKEHYKANKDRILKKIHEYSAKNKQSISANKSEYYKENKEKLSAYKKEYRKKNIKKIRVKHNKYQLKRMENDPLFRIVRNTRSLIHHSIKRNGWGKRTKTEMILGCPFETFKSYIQIKFQKDMTWENQGEIWELDHIIPVTSAKNTDEAIRLNHFTNFQPLYKEYNRIKFNKMPDEWDKYCYERKIDVTVNPYIL